MIRTSKREQIKNFFTENVGVQFGTFDMHSRYGTAFRTRVSEINRDENSSITIRNKTIASVDADRSYYWSEMRQSQAVSATA